MAGGRNWPPDPALFEDAYKESPGGMMHDARVPRKGFPVEITPASEVVELIPALRAFAISFCRDASEADDLVQETLLKGLANIHRFEPGTRLKSWLFTIMRNTHYTRAKLAARERPGAENCASAQPTTLPSQEWSVRGREVARAVRSLPHSQREVLVLIAVLGMSYIEAAGICGCAVGTVKSRLSRARHELMTRLGEADAKDVVRIGAGPY
jgi:RNA polymerase sigma factor (sigma-70 family)